MARIEIADGARPVREELLKEFPSSLSVLLGPEKTPAEIPVEWRCVGDEYEKGDSYYYQFCPVWDENFYPLSPGFDVIRDAPYAAVFVR